MRGRKQPSIARIAAILLGLVIAAVVLCTGTLLVALQGDDGLFAQYDAAAAIKASLSRDASGKPVVEPTPALDRLRQALPDLWYVVATEEGTVRYGPVPDAVRVGELMGGSASRYRAGGDKLILERATVPARLGGEAVQIQLGGAVYTRSQVALSSLRDVNYTGIPTLAVIVTTIAIALSVVPALIARPVRRVSDAAERIDGARGGLRLPVDAAPRELVPMVIAFNKALERIDETAATQRRFLSNAAHELRTPLARVRTRLEQVDDATLRRALVDDVQALSSTVTMLLQLARLSSGSPEMQRIDLVAIVRATTAEHVPAALAADVEIEFSAPEDRVVIGGSDTAIRVAVGNLVRNAVQHGRAGKCIQVEVRAPGIVRVSDRGEGIRSLDREEALQPFVRGRPGGDGAGLGLAIVAQVMALHGGTVAMEETQGGGLTVALAFPPGAA